MSLVEAYANERRRLLGMAYRITGVWADAEEVVAEAYARLVGRTVDEPVAWLTTVTTRLAVDRLRARQREAYVGPWLPEPVDTGLLPEETAVQRQSLHLGLLQLCEQLSPPQRAAFVLREAYAMSYREIGEVLQVSEVTARQHVTRARRRLDADADPPSAGADLAALQRLGSALASGDVVAVTALLTEDVELWTDGGGVVSAARRVVLGPDNCARFLIGTAQEAVVRPISANAQVAIESTAGGVRRLAWVLVRGDRVTQIHIQSNPAKLTRV